MLGELERCSKLPGLETTASFGPFSVFQVDMIRAQSANANDWDANNSHSYEDVPVCRSPGGPSQRRESLIITELDEDVDDYVPSLSQGSPVSLSSGPMIVSPSSEYPSFWMNKLLSHYILRVADVSQPISHPQNPFRSIHAQYAMDVWTKPLIDMSRGPQTAFLNHRVIFYSIISTAAFHLRGLVTIKHPKWKFYNCIGRTHRLKALICMQEAMKEPSFDAESHCARISAIHTLIDSDVSF